MASRSWAVAARQGLTRRSLRLSTPPRTRRTVRRMLAPDRLDAHVERAALKDGHSRIACSGVSAMPLQSVQSGLGASLRPWREASKDDLLKRRRALRAEASLGSCRR